MSRSRGLRAFGLFVAVWLNLALAPCAMAYEALQDHDCPHCPPAQSHDGHHDGHDMQGATAQLSCADSLADCMIEDEASHDGRQGWPGHFDDSEVVGISLSDDLRATVPHGSAFTVPRYASIHPGAPPPIYLLNCVFLD